MLSENSALLEDALERCYERLPSGAAVLGRTQRYGALGGGKRIRAFILLRAAELFGGDRLSALPYACALEMIHASSLVHDDMPCMDNDDMRRGKPSLHKKYGEAAALITGDAMTVKAFEVAVKNPHMPSGANAEAVKILAEAAGDCGMLAGQALDTVSVEEITDLDSLIRLHSLKTGRLIEAAARLGCLCADISDTDPRYLAALRYARAVGLAFQIEDDILDFVEGKAEERSFLAYMSPVEAEDYVTRLSDEAIDAIREYDDGTFAALARYLAKREY